jgi:hypothetical protein
MRKIRQTVDDGDGGRFRQGLHLFLAEGADHDPVAIALQHPGGILRRFSPDNLGFLPAEKQGVPPSWYIPTSKETLVRVEFFSKIIARVLPSKYR